MFFRCVDGLNLGFLVKLGRNHFSQLLEVGMRNKFISLWKEDLPLSQVTDLSFWEKKHTKGTESGVLEAL